MTYVAHQVAPLHKTDPGYNNKSANNYNIWMHYNLNVISGLFVVVSWMSFLVPPDVISGRMALLITIFLVLVNIFNSVTSNTPKAEGRPAIIYTEFT